MNGGGRPYHCRTRPFNVEPKRTLSYHQIHALAQELFRMIDEMVHFLIDTLLVAVYFSSENYHMGMLWGSGLRVGFLQESGEYK